MIKCNKRYNGKTKQRLNVLPLDRLTTFLTFNFIPKI